MYYTYFNTNLVSICYRDILNILRPGTAAAAAPPVAASAASSIGSFKDPTCPFHGTNGPFQGHHASHKSNPSSVPQGYMDLNFTLPWVTWEVVTGVEGIPCWGFLWHTLANGALVYPYPSHGFAFMLLQSECEGKYKNIIIYNMYTC